MKKRIYRFIIPIIVLSFLFHLSIYASPTDTVTTDLTNFYQNIKNVYKQIDAIGKTGYINFINNKDNDILARNLDTYINQIGILNAEINDYINSIELTPSQLSRAQALVSSTNALNFMANTLSSYLAEKDPSEQYELLKIYLQRTPLFNQILSIAVE